MCQSPVRGDDSGGEDSGGPAEESVFGLLVNELREALNAAGAAERSKLAEVGGRPFRVTANAALQAARASAARLAEAGEILGRSQRRAIAFEAASLDELSRWFRSMRPRSGRSAAHGSGGADS